MFAAASLPGPVYLPITCLPYCDRKLGRAWEATENKTTGFVSNSVTSDIPVCAPMGGSGGVVISGGVKLVEAVTGGCVRETAD